MEHCKLLAGSSTSTTPPAPPHRLCLETSFTSYSVADSVAPTANGVNSDSNHLPWEFVSLVPSPQSQDKRSDFIGSSEPIHDDWFGLAPLATPESFSEVSSISSRASSMTFGHLKAPDSGRVKRKSKGGHSNIKESLSVRFDETLNDVTDISMPSDEYCTDSHPKNILTRLFKRKRSKFDEKSLTEHEQLPHDSNNITTDEHNIVPIDSPPKVDDSITSTESSPLLSSLHLLTDQRFAEILGRPLISGNGGNTTVDDLNNDSVSSTSFRSGDDSLQDIHGTVSSDSVTVNAEVHKSPEELLSGLRSESSLGGDSLLEDIERSLNISLSRTGSSARLTSLSRNGSGARLTEVEIDISDTNDKGGLVTQPGSLPSSHSISNKFMYPILHVTHGESSV